MCWRRVTRVHGLVMMTGNLQTAVSEAQPESCISELQPMILQNLFDVLMMFVWLSNSGDNMMMPNNVTETVNLFFSCISCKEC